MAHYDRRLTSNSLTSRAADVFPPLRPSRTLQHQVKYIAIGLAILPTFYVGWAVSTVIGMLILGTYS